MPDYEIRLLAADGSISQIHVTVHPNDQAAIAHARTLASQPNGAFEVRRGMTVVWPRAG